MCILSREIYRHITLVDSRRGSQKFHQGKLLHYSLCLAKNVCLRISLCIGLIPLISRRVFTWCPPAKYGRFLITQVCACLPMWIHYCLKQNIYEPMVYVLLIKFISKHVGKNGFIFQIAKCWQQQLTGGSDAQEVSLIFLKSLYIFLGAAPSPA